MMKNKKNTSSILEFNGGAILERIDLELSKVLKNIMKLFAILNFLIRGRMV